LGCGLASPMLGDPAARLRRICITAAAAVAIAVAAATQIPVLDDWRAEVTDRFAPLEKKSLALFNDALTKLKASQITEADFSQTVDKQILPPWNAERDRLAKLKLAKDHKAFAAMLVEYMSLRGEGWSLMAKGAVENDVTLVKAANQKQAAADAVVNRINGPGKK
jgi:hypothetical protein